MKHHRPDVSVPMIETFWVCILLTRPRRLIRLAVIESAATSFYPVKMYDLGSIYAHRSPATSSRCLISPVSLISRNNVTLFQSILPDGDDPKIAK